MNYTPDIDLSFTRDPMWNGGCAVCKHTRESAPRSPNLACALCGFPIEWHKESVKELK